MCLASSCGKESKQIKKASAQSASPLAQQNQSELMVQKLEFALEADDTLLVREALSKESVNFLLPGGETPLTHALKYNKLAIVREVLGHAPNLDLINLANETPLQIIIENGLYYHFKLLLDSGLPMSFDQAINNEGPVEYAIKFQDQLMAIELLKSGAQLDCWDVDSCDAYREANSLKFHDLSLLIKAALFLKTRPDIDNKTIVKEVLSYNSLHVLEYAALRQNLKNRAKGANLLSEIIKSEFKEKQRSVSMLLKRGFNPNGELADTELPLITAVKHKSFDCLIFLLRNGADPNKTDEQNFSPLIHAIKNLEVSKVKTLLQYSAAKSYSYQINSQSPRYIVDACRFVPDISRGIFRRSNLKKWNQSQQIKKLLQCD